MSSQCLVTKEVVDAYQRDGAVLLKGLFTPNEVALAKSGIEKAMALKGPHSEFLVDDAGGGTFFNDYCHWREIPEFEEYIMRSKAAEAVATLMKSRTAVIYHEHVLVKEAGALKATPWHHDLTYYPVSGTQTCSLWMPTDPVPMESTLKFIAGSHSTGRQFHPRKFKTASEYPPRTDGLAADPEVPYETIPDDAELENDSVILGWELEPGDAVAFNFATLHGAAGNASKTMRAVISTRWLGDDCRCVRRPWTESPPYTGGLNVGDPFVCEMFPVVFPPQA